MTNPFFFRSAADPEVLFVGTAPPDALQPDGKIWRIAGGMARPAAISPPFVVSDNYLSRATASPAHLRDTSGTTLAVAADTKRGLSWRLSFHGLHLRRPVYYPMAFPDPSYAGFHWVDSYTGTRRLGVWRGDAPGPLAVFEQRVWNSATTLVLSDVAHYDQALGLLAIVDSLRSTGRLMVVDLKE